LSTMRASLPSCKGPGKDASPNRHLRKQPVNLVTELGAPSARAEGSWQARSASKCLRNSLCAPEDEHSPVARSLCRSTTSRRIYPLSAEEVSKSVKSA